MNQSNLKLPLFILRATIAIFFLVWGFEKFVDPETTVAIWKSFYMIDNLPVAAAYSIGALQIAVVACFFFGILKFWSYGFLMVIHALSTLSTYEQLLSPYEGNHHLFVAAIPALGALIALFLLRDEDTLFTLSRRRRSLN